MKDRELLIERLERLAIVLDELMPRCAELVRDALELLKEQEPVKPLAQADDTFECSCGAIVGWDELDASGIVHTHFNYCPFCGRAIKWDES